MKSYGTITFDSVSKIENIKLDSSSTFPTKPKEGMLYYLTITNGEYRRGLYVYANNNWLPLDNDILTNGNNEPIFFILDQTGNKVPVTIFNYTVPFFLDSAGVKNINLNMYGSLSASTGGFIVPRSGYITMAWAQIGKVITEDCTFQLLKNGEIIYSVVVNANSVRASASNMNIKINAGDELLFFISSNKNVARPMAHCTIHWI